MLKVSNVSYSYGKHKALDNLSFELKEGELLGLLGPNGCGKTTTFRLITGLIKPASGNISFNNQQVSFANINEISYLIEERALNPKYKVKEMLYFLGRLKGLTKQYLDDHINKWLDFFNLTKMVHKKVSELSKGNQQKVQFISCLLNKPKLLVLDEPLTGLDVINQQELVLVIKKLKEKGVMVIFSSHQINQVEKFCDKVCLINKGKLIISGYLKEIKENYPKRIIKFLADDVDLDKLSTLEGITKITKEEQYYLVEISNKQYLDKIFKYIQKLSNLTFLSSELASLEEIFITEVKEQENHE